jgi:hypothetical protein
VIDVFLSKLERVKSTGPDRWIARCPAHEDGTPSLTVMAVSDGRILAHCFGGCSIEAVVSAVGMTLSDLMPERPLLDFYPRPRIPAGDVLEAMAINAMIVAFTAADMANGKQLTEEERTKLFQIAADFQDAVELTGSTHIRDEILNEVRKCQ